MPLFELGMVLSPDFGDEEREAFLAEVRQLLEGQGCTMVKEDVWGKRTLAYEIKHRREGFYTFWQFEGPGTAIAPLEYRLRLSDEIFRYLTLNLDRELQRKRKMDQLRADRKAAKASAKAKAQAQIQAQAEAAAEEA